METISSLQEYKLVNFTHPAHLSFFKENNMKKLISYIAILAYVMVMSINILIITLYCQTQKERINFLEEKLKSLEMKTEFRYEMDTIITNDLVKRIKELEEPTLIKNKS